MHFAWKADFDNAPAYTRAAILNAKALAGVKLTAGFSLVGHLPEISLDIISDYPPADYFNAGPLFVVSERLRGLLESANAAIEYHPVVLFKDGHEIHGGGYCFANLLKKIDCFNFEKSIYTMDGEFIDKIQRLEIDESKADGNPLFRLARSFDVITLASQDLRDTVLGAGITGVKFFDPADWKW